jgi:large conductance mechanosensitive channel
MVMQGFRKFLLRGNVVDLAVGVVIGAAFGAVVTALVKGLITPLIGLLLGTPDLSALNVEVSGQKFLVGDFVNAVIAFVLVALVVYYAVVVPVNRLMDRFKPAPAPAAPTKECPECLSKIPVAARRCAFCTTVLVDDGAATASETVAVAATAAN